MFKFLYLVQVSAPRSEICATGIYVASNRAIKELNEYNFCSCCSLNTRVAVVRGRRPISLWTSELDGRLIYFLRMSRFENHRTKESVNFILTLKRLSMEIEGLEMDDCDQNGLI